MKRSQTYYGVEIIFSDGMITTKSFQTMEEAVNYVETMKCTEVNEMYVSSVHKTKVV